jgi:hypothetical protein
MTITITNLVNDAYSTYNNGFTVVDLPSCATYDIVALTITFLATCGTDPLLYGYYFPFITASHLFSKAYTNTV